MASDHSPSPPPLHFERERKLSTKTKKQPPLKKRHTKPCKFFQIGRCPYSADECNFAHVLVVPTPMLPLSPGVGVGGICKYYSVGRSSGGGMCSCGHDHDLSSLGAHLSNLQLSPSSPVSPVLHYPRPPNPYPPGYYHPVWPAGPYNEHPSTSPINTGRNPAGQSIGSKGPGSPSVSISASTESSAISQLETPDPDGGPTLASLSPSGTEKHGAKELQDEGDANVNQVHNSDEDVIVTENPQFSEHAHNPHQSQIRVMDVEHAPYGIGYGYGGHGHGHGGIMGGGYPLSPPPPWEAGNTHYFAPSPTLGFGDHKTPRTSPPTRSSSRASSRSKTAKYKTKPCKFFNTEGGCPSGGSCTFIHDASIPPVPPIARSRSKSPKPHGSADDHTRPYSIAKDKKRDGKPEKAESQTDIGEVEDNKDKRKNFFPITWRVIGGGVLIGGKRAADSMDNIHAGQGGPSAEGVAEGERADDAPTRKKSLFKFGIGGSRPRSRSTSAPPTRPVFGGGKGGSDTLFPAESP